MRNMFFKLIILFFICFSLSYAELNEAQIIAKMSSKSLYEFDAEGLDKILNQYLKEKDYISAIQIVDLSYNEIFWNYNKKDREFECKEPLVKLSEPIIYDSKEIGRVDICHYNKVQADNIKISFTAEEKKWLEKNPIIKIANMIYWPVDIFNKNIHVDYINLLGKYGGLNISIVGYPNWGEGFKAASKGDEVHGILNLSWSQEREEKYFDYAKPYFYTPMYIVTKKDNYSIKSIEDLKDKVVLSKENSITNQVIKQVKLNIKPIVLKDNFDMAKALSKDDTEAEALFTYVLDKELFERYGLKVAKEFYNRFGEVHVGVSKKYPILKSILEKAHEKIPTSELNFIQNKNYNYKKSEMINLSSEEIAWLEDNKDITFGGNPNWMPFEAFNDKGEYIGFVSEYLELIEKNTTLEFNKIQTSSWSKTLQLAQDGKLDVVSGDIYDSLLNRYFNSIPSYLNSEVIIVMDEKQQFIENLNNIADKKIAVIKGYGYLNELYRKYPKIKFYEVDNVDEGLNDLVQKKYDAMLGTVGLMSYTIKQKGYQNLRIVGNTGVKMYLTLFVKKDKPQLQSILSKFMNSIDQDTHLRIKNKYNQIDLETVVDYTVIWYIIIFFIAIFVVFTYYNRRLKILVDEKTFQLQDLVKNMEKIVETRTKELKEEKEHAESLNEELQEAKEKAELVSKQKSEF